MAPTSSASLETFVAEAKDLVASALADGNLDAGEVLRIAIFVAEKVNVLKDLSGTEKKALVVRAIEMAVKAAVPPEQAERVGSSVALQVLPSVLDIAVSAARGKVFLARAADVRKKFSWGCLAGCLGGLLKGKKPAEVVEDLVKMVVEPEPAPAQEPPAAPSEAPSAAPSQSATPESETTAAPQPENLPSKDETLPQESQTAPSPQASAEEAPVETRPAEVPAQEPPSSATTAPESVLEPAA